MTKNVARSKLVALPDWSQSEAARRAVMQQTKDDAKLGEFPTATEVNNG